MWPSRPTSPTRRGAIGGAVLLHPIPDSAGTASTPWSPRCSAALPAVGITALRFDFRPGAGADGTTFVDERVDAVTALDALAAHLPNARLHLVGYSFGAGVALGVKHPAVTSRVVIAPPLTVMDIGTPPPLPTLVLVPEFDNFAPPAVVAPIVADWPDTTMEVIDGGRPLHGRPRRGGGGPRGRLALDRADRQLRAVSAAVNRCNGATAASIARRSRASNVASASSTTRWRSARHCSTRAAPCADGRSDGDAAVPAVGAALDEPGPQQHRHERADGVGRQRRRVGGGRHGDARRLDDEHQQLDGGRLDRGRCDPRPHGPARRATQRRHRIAELTTEGVGRVGHDDRTYL